MLISHGDPMTFVRHPVSLTLLLATLALLATVLIPGIRRSRRTIFAEAQPGD